MDESGERQSDRDAFNEVTSVTIGLVGTLTILSCFII